MARKNVFDVQFFDGMAAFEAFRDDQDDTGYMDRLDIVEDPDYICIDIESTMRRPSDFIKKVIRTLESVADDSGRDQAVLEDLKAFLDGMLETWVTFHEFDCAAVAKDYSYGIEYRGLDPECGLYLWLNVNKGRYTA